MIADERYTDYINSLQSVVPETLMPLYMQACADGVPVIKQETQAYLRFLVQEKKPQQILEIGTAVGFSALFMNFFQPPGGQITTIEKDPARAKEAAANFAACGRQDRIRLLTGDAADLLETLPAKQFDLVFMDAAKGQYIRFLPPVKTLLRPGGILVSDNVLRGGQIIESRFAVRRRDRTIHTRMREYLAALTHDPALCTTILTIGDGVALSLLLSEETCSKNSGIS